MCNLRRNYNELWKKVYELQSLIILGANVSNRKLLFCDFKKGVLFVFTMNDDFGGPFKQGI